MRVKGLGWRVLSFLSGARSLGLGVENLGFWTVKLKAQGSV